MDGDLHKTKLDAWNGYQSFIYSKGQWQPNKPKSPHDWINIVLYFLFEDETDAPDALLKLQAEDKAIFQNGIKILVRRLQRIIEKVRSNPSIKSRTLNEFQEQDFYTSGEDTAFDELLSRTLKSQFGCTNSSSPSFEPSSQGVSVDLPSQGTSVGEMKVPFSELSSKAARACSQPVYENILTFLKEEQIEMDEFLGYIGQRYYHLTDKKKSTMFASIRSGENPFKSTKLDTSKALYLREKLQIGCRVYNSVRSVDDSVKWPAWHELQSASQNLLPEVEEFLDGVRVSFKPLLTKTISSQLSLIGNDISLTTKAGVQRDGITVNLSLGCDGSGRHAQYNMSDSLAIDTTHMLLSGFHLQSIVSNGPDKAVLFTESSMSSDTERPLHLVPGLENRDLLRKVMQDLEKQVEDAERGFSVEAFGQDVQVTLQTKLSQLDGKAISLVLGLGSAFCTLCKVSEQDAQNPVHISEGFMIDRTLSGIHDLHRKLAVEDETGELRVPRRSHDYHKRSGLTQQPVLSSSNIMSSLPVMHAYPRALSFFEDVAYRYNSRESFPNGIPVWRRGHAIGQVAKRAKEEAKNTFRAEARQPPLNLKLDMPDASGHGGNSDTANMAGSFFSEEKRESVLGLFHTGSNTADRKNLHDLLQGYSIVLRVISSKSRQIDVPKFELFCKEIALLQKEAFPWAPITPSMHKVLAHSGQLIQRNGGYGLGAQSEEPLEGCHKVVRKFREHLGRKTSLKENLEDVLKRLILRSAPEVRAFNKLKSCSKCQGIGHTSRFCIDVNISSKDNDIVE